MKIFVFKASSPMWIEAVKRLAREGVEILYWAGSKAPWEAVRRDRGGGVFEKTVFHDALDAVEGIPPPEFAGAFFPPVGKDTLDKLCRCERQTLVMMNTVDHENAVSVAKRRRRYLSYVRYWHGVLSRMRPDAVIFGDMPHNPFQYVAYHVAKLLGIPTLMYLVIQVKGRMMVLDDIERYGALERELERGKGTRAALEDLSPDVAAFYRVQALAEADPTPFYMKESFVRQWSTGGYRLPSLGKILRHTARLTLLPTAFSYLAMLVRKKRIANLERLEVRGFEMFFKRRAWNRVRRGFAREWKRFEREPDLAKPFVYLPLHNQPERSTSAMGDVFVDQILFAELLAGSLPEGWELYVKENPLQWRAPRTHTGRFRGYAEELAKIPNVRLVSPAVSTYELIEKSRAVASVTSTACWEAVLRGKPALVGGYVFFMHCDGVFRVADPVSAKDAFAKIAAGYRPDPQKVIDFLAAVDRASIPGFPNRRFRELQGLTISEEEGARIVADALRKELDRLVSA